MTYCKNILELKRKALSMNLCDKYKEKWDNARTYRELINIVSDLNGADFLCSGISKGWGLEKDFITRYFGEYINGYTVYHKGYNSEIYNGLENEVITCNVSVMIILYSKCEVIVQENHYCHIFVAGESSEVIIRNNGNVFLHDYSGNTSIIDTEKSYKSKINPYNDNHSWVNF